MRLDPPLKVGRLLRRYKRFLADVEASNGSVITIHCPNTGAMLGCDVPGSEVWYSWTDKAGRKYPHTLEVVVTATGRAGVNTGRGNALVAEALAESGLAEFENGAPVRAEPAIPDESGRFDFHISEGTRNCWVEVKSVTLCDEAGTGSFPDAVSARALKHVRALQRRVVAGDRGVLVFCVQHTGIVRVTTADGIDPAYGAAVRQAQRAGLEVLAYSSRLERDEFLLERRLPVLL